MLNTESAGTDADERPTARPLSVQDVGLLFNQALDKSNPKLQEAAVRLLAVFPHKGGEKKQSPLKPSMSILKSLFAKPLNVVIAITCLVVILYFGIRIFNDLRPRTLDERKMGCLKLGSNLRYSQCLRLIQK